MADLVDQWEASDLTATSDPGRVRGDGRGDRRGDGRGDGGGDGRGVCLAEMNEHTIVGSQMVTPTSAVRPKLALFPGSPCAQIFVDMCAGGPEPGNRLTKNCQ